jgi:MTH538 TIR-like domain (DUF1863)
MADPRAFISFDFDHDDNQRILFAGQSKHSKTPFNIQDWSCKEELAQSKWEAEIKEKINKCNLMVVLVGKNTYWATGVGKEIKWAAEQNVPFFGVYVDGADTSTLLPTNLNRNRVVTWTWDGIASAVKQMMGEGKNKNK